MRVSGCNGHSESVLGVGAKAKSVTNNLPLLSVLCLGEMLNSRSNYNYYLYDSILSRCNSLKNGQAFIITSLIYFVGKTSYKTDRTKL